MAECNDDFNDEDIRYIINAQDGLPNVHPNLFPEQDIDESQLNEDDELEGLPSSLIVTNVQDYVFSSPGFIIQFLLMLNRLNAILLQTRNATWRTYLGSTIQTSHFSGLKVFDGCALILPAR